MIDAMKEQGRQSRMKCGQMTFLLSNAFIIIYLSWALLLPALLSSSSDHVIAPREQQDEHHPSITRYYPLRINNYWAAYIPTYLALLFLFVPPLYMGLNMKSVPPDDGIDWIWDTRSNTNNSYKNSRQDDNSKTLISIPTIDNCIHGDGNGFTILYSLPEICDVDVRTINSRIHRVK